MLTIMPHLPAGTIVVSGCTGEERKVKWSNGGHVQYENGTSCSWKNFKMFHSECDIIRPGETGEWISGDDRTRFIDNR